MSKTEEAVKRGLGKKKSGGTHTHKVTYERAGNGGYVADVEKHHGKGPHSEGHSHSETHVLPDFDAAQEHLQENMGDQPAAGEMTTPAPQQAPGGMPTDPAAAQGM